MGWEGTDSPSYCVLYKQHVVTGGREGGDSEKADPKLVDTGGGQGMGRECGGVGSPLPQVRCGGL